MFSFKLFSAKKIICLPCSRFGMSFPACCSLIARTSLGCECDWISITFLLRAETIPEFSPVVLLSHSSFISCDQREVVESTFIFGGRVK